MEPIISPWTIYLINLTYNISQLLLAIATTCAILSVATILIIAIYDDDGFGTNKEFRDKCTKFLKYSIPTIFIAITINTFIPSRDVMIAMIVSSYITPDNLNGANEAIKVNLQDYIHMIVNNINGAK